MTPLPREKNNITKTGVSHTITVTSHIITPIITEQRTYATIGEKRDYRKGDTITLREINETTQRTTGISITAMIKDVNEVLINECHLLFTILELRVLLVSLHDEK